jgi:hypothetical protein
MNKPNDIVARATITFDTQEVVYVEIKMRPSFHNFYTVYRVEDGKQIETPGSVNQGQANNLEEAAKKIADRWSKVKRKVTDTHIEIFEEIDYLRLLETDPSELGLATVSRRTSIPNVSGPARLPVEYTTLQRRMDILNPRKKKGGA